MKIFELASKRSKAIGSLLAVAHFLVSWWVIVDLVRSDFDAQWQLIWIFFLPFDLPFSLITFYGPRFLPPVDISVLPHPLNNFYLFFLPTFIHGIIGTFWYFLFPTLISHSYNKILKKKPGPE